jgi:chromosome segregation ATPase
MYQVFNKIKRNYIHYKDMKENNKNNFRTKFEMNYTKEKNNLINDNNNSIKSLQRDIQILKKNINQLTTKESELKSEIFNFLQEEKQLSEKIKSIETLNSSLKKSIQTSNSSSIKTISKYDTDILSLESDLKFNKNLKEEKKEIINAFMNKVYILLNEYQAYIDNLKTLDLSASNTNTNTNNNMNNELTSSSNLQSIKQKDTMENSLIASKFSARNQSNDM